MRIEALVINVLSRKRPLYSLHEFYEFMDVEKRFGKVICRNNLTDYNLARNLSISWAGDAHQSTDFCRC